MTQPAIKEPYYLKCANGTPHPLHRAGPLDEINKLGDKLDGRGYPGPHTEALPCGPHSTIGVNWFPIKG